jgi:Rha family phage regulatory protein
VEEIITIRRDQAVTSSLQVAKDFGKRHDNVIRAIERLQSDLLKIKEVEDSAQLKNEGSSKQVKFMKSTYKDSTGRSLPMYYMNRDGFSLLVMGFTGKKALEWKLKYIEAFNTMEKILTEKQTAVWIETRKQGKLTRRSETDVIKELVEYAKAQGSTHADMLYMTYTKLANSIVGIKDRDSATITQLNSLSFVENIILHTIRNGMALNLSYKEIYQANKKQLEMFSDISFLPQMLALDGG